MKLKSYGLTIFLLVAIFIWFIIKGNASVDPDFGWHLKIGELIAAYGIPATDPFSYSMPSYPFVDHEWLADIVLAKIYALFGMGPLIIGFAFLGTLSLGLLFKGVDKKWVSLPLFLAAGALFDFMGIRMQVISWVFMALLMNVLWQKSLWERWRWVLPFLFLVWANLHGGFAIGIVVLGIFIVGKSLEERQLFWKDYLLLVLSVLATFINPYGLGLWVEVTKSLTDTSLRWTIQEWYPAVYFTNFAFWMYTLLSVFLLIRYWRRFSFTEMTIYFLLLASGLSSMRNIPLFMVASFYLTMRGIAYLSEDVAKHTYGLERFKISYKVFFIVCLIFFLPQLGMFFYGSYIQAHGKGSYPQGAVAYLRTHLPEGQIFSSYDWGGYLIWKLPEKKVFMDGRMPSWKNAQAPSNESKDAFGDYKKVFTNKLPFAELAAEYDIDTLLISASELKEEKVKFLGIDVEKSSFLKRFFAAEMNFSIEQIKKMGWVEVYKDDTAVIFQKPKTGTSL